MKKLTELDLQNALDECEVIKFRTHGDWLAGMVKRLNAVLEERKPRSARGASGSPQNQGDDYMGGFPERPALKPMPFLKKTVVKTGNSTEPETSCVS